MGSPSLGFVGLGCTSPGPNVEKGSISTSLRRGYRQQVPGDASAPPEPVGRRTSQPNGQELDPVTSAGIDGLEATLDIHVNEQCLAELQMRYLMAAGAYRILPQDTKDALVTTYISSFNGVLPIVDAGNLLRQYYLGRASERLIQAVCLLACKNQQAVPYLRLSGGGKRC